MFGKNKNKGFTLVELLIGIAVITVLSSISLASFISYKRQGTVKSAAQKLTSDFRRAQGFALGLKSFDTASGQVVPKGGWGVYMRLQPPAENKNYIIFADYNGVGGVPDKLYDISEKYFTHVIEGARINTITLERSNHTTVNRNWVNITFEPPVPTVNICANNTSDCDYISAEIKLISDTDNTTSSVFVNNIGLIEVF
ncbi:MAG: putative major pilin subunit [Parcubacteria group bacterium ADurb.Bin316]|nr:MAG: putative major pilin subunit [Parcubacteria group bacterium ADurb.Bin316]HOZ56502.1 prepilin-type N-terminal cleavage/methylation domain-containing protein [bacterium]